VITQITASRGYITTSAGVASKIVQPKWGSLKLDSIPGVCSNSNAETAIFQGNGASLPGAVPVDDVPAQPF
jgi:hypothetical protein